MGVLDTPLRAVAKSVLPKFGTSATIERAGTYNAATDTTGAGTSHATNVVFEEFAQHLVDGEIVQSGDQIAHIPALGLSITPSPEKDRLKVGSDSWQIVRVMSVQPGDTAIAYKLHVRR